MRHILPILLIIFFTASSAWAMTAKSIGIESTKSSSYKTPKVYNAQIDTTRPLVNPAPGQTVPKEYQQKYNVQTKKRSNLYTTKKTNPYTKQKKVYSKGNRAKDYYQQSALKQVQGIARVCPGAWEGQTCLKATAGAAWALSAGYMYRLTKGKQKRAATVIKEECAASTAPIKKANIPAYAMRSAYTTCANTISAVAKKTGIKPNLSYYQILVASATCLDKKRTNDCNAYEQELITKYRK